MTKKMHARLRKVTHTRLLELLHYDPLSGIFKWRVNRRKVKAGDTASCPNGQGYIVIGVDGVLYRANRLAWFYMSGDWPKGEVDHMDTCPSNNAWLNLRDVSHAINKQNMRRATKSNKLGLLGVHLPSGRTKYRAVIDINGKRKQLGNFSTPEEASAVYVAAKRQLHPGCTL